MTREEAKIFLPMLQAYAEGKTIEVRSKGAIPEEFNKWCEVMDLYFWPNCEYREKPEPKYRPFKSAKECWEEMQKHQPFGWVKTCAGAKVFIHTVSADYFINGYNEPGQEFSESMNYTFADGTPFGMMEQ